MHANQFILPNGVYMCGHSLGPMPITTVSVVHEALMDFSQYGVAAWNKSAWIDLPQNLAQKIARLIGAKSEEVVVTDSTTVNLYKVIQSARDLQKDRHILLTSEDNFPADIYIAEGIERCCGLKLKRVPSIEIEEHLNEKVAILMLSHVHYRDSSVFDMQDLGTKAHSFGILCIWDLSHSTGIIPLNLEQANADFAVGCTYKYLSGGPGSPAFLYVNTKHHSTMKSPIQGWMGHAKPFDFAPNFFSDAASQFMGGTPPILSLKGLEAALNLFDTISINDLYQKTQEFSALLISALKDLGMDVCMPKKRGGHVAFNHPEGYAISRALIAAGVLCDFRPPHLIRLCVNALYLAPADLLFCIEEMTQIMQKKRYQNTEYHQHIKVT